MRRKWEGRGGRGREGEGVNERGDGRVGGREGGVGWEEGGQGRVEAGGGKRERVAGWGGGYFRVIWRSPAWHWLWSQSR